MGFNALAAGFNLLSILMSVTLFKTTVRRVTFSILFVDLQLQFPENMVDWFPFLDSILHIVNDKVAICSWYL